MELTFLFETATASDVPSADRSLDVLLVGPDILDPEILSVLRSRPHLSVLRIESNGHDLTVHQLRPHRWVKHDSNPRCSRSHP
jgi:hypothetical protein